MQLRIARHSSDLKKISRFYTEIIGLQILGEFQDHDGYNGIFLGLEDSAWHLEFTSSPVAPNHHPDEDDLLVFYPETSEAYKDLHQRLLENAIFEEPARNPYWNRNGICISDPDGFKIVISPKRINNQDRL